MTSVTKKSQPSRLPLLRSSTKTQTKKNEKSKNGVQPAAKKVLAPRLTQTTPVERKTLEAPAASNQEKVTTPILTDLPFSYNVTRLVLMVRDPEWAFGYWDFSGDSWNWIVAFLSKDHFAKPKLRIHNLDHKHYYDLDVYLEAKNWYLHLGLPDTSFEAELGILDSSGKFHVIARSNRVRTPRNSPSSKVDEAWLASDAEMREIYQLSGGGKTGHGSEIFSSFRRR